MYRHDISNILRAAEGNGFDKDADLRLPQPIVLQQRVCNLSNLIYVHVCVLWCLKISRSQGWFSPTHGPLHSMIIDIDKNWQDNVPGVPVRP